MAIVQRLARTPLATWLAAAVALAAIWAAAPDAARPAMMNSAILAGAATAIALPLGTLLAVLITRFDLPGRRLAAACLGVLLFLPLYVQLAGWDAAVGKIGWLTLAYGHMDEPFLAGMRGAVFVHAMAAVPWVALVVGLGLSQVDPAQEEAALLILSPIEVLFRVTLRQAVPFILAAAVLTVVATTSEMTVTNIFLINPMEQTFTEQFYMTFALQADAGEAARSVWPAVAGLGVLITLSLWMAIHAARRTHWFSAQRPVTFTAGTLRPFAAALMWLLIAVLLAIPIGSLISKAGFVVVHEGSKRVQSWSLAKCVEQVAQAPAQFSFEFRWTIITALGAATCALAAAVALAWPARRGGWRAMPAIAAVVLGLTIPGPLVGVSLIWVFNRSLWPNVFDPLVYLYDRTPVVVMFAQAIHALPITLLVCWYSFRTLSDDVLAAAALDGAPPRQVLWRIALPLRWQALAGAWLAAFAIAAGDVAWAQLVRPAGMDLIQRRVLGLVHSGVDEQVAAISLINVIAYAVLTGLILWLVGPRRNWRRVAAAGDL
ncbi:MAG TPA: ABC transporter permease subunit [Pirellulaceae bacterium]|nr:ABC transporter permease subunit [Pirellulaceae bacterium]